MPSFKNTAGTSLPWLIQIPLDELVALQGLPAQMEELRKENKQLRRELEGLRNIQNQTIERLSLVNEFIRRQPKG